MPFDQSVITDGPNFTRFGAKLLVSWDSSAPDSQPFQLYADGVLVWSGVARSVVLPYPKARTLYRVGAVDPPEAGTDLSSTLAPIAGSGGAARATLTWHGGTYLDPGGVGDVAGFRVYGESAPGGGIDYGTPLATVMAYRNNIVGDGWGVGGWGEGGWGLGAGRYSWTTDPLAAGTWHWGVKAFDGSGNEGTARTISLAVASPPRPPAADASGKRLSYSYNSTTHVPTLNWAASP